MAHHPLFACLAAFTLLACDAEESSDLDNADHGDGIESSILRGHPHHVHPPHPGHRPNHRCRTKPDWDWKVAAPEQHGLSSAGLAQVAQVAEATNTTCMVVIADGELVGEWYWDGFDASTPIPDLWSVTKSVTSLAVGIAEAEGLLDIHDPVADYVPEWQGTASEEVTIFDLLTHTSGREWDFFSDFAILEAEDHTAYSLGFGQTLAPGTRFDYSNLGVQTLEAVLEAAVGGDVGDYIESRLFARLGMDATLARDPSGNPILYTGLSTTCRDLARLGYMLENRGRWRGKRIVPNAWLVESATAATDLNDAYGYLWWLNRPGHVVLSSIPERVEFDGKIFPSAPNSMVMALGAFGQFIAIDRQRDLVVVRATLDYDMSDPLALADMDAIFAALAAAAM